MLVCSLGRYAKAMEHRIKDWVEALIEIQNVMDAWLKVGVIPPSAMLLRRLVRLGSM